MGTKDRYINVKIYLFWGGWKSIDFVYVCCYIKAKGRNELS
jgi:hypothetical protein